MPVTVIDLIKPKNNGKFPICEDVDIKGGFRVVDTLVERDAITIKHKKKGMLCLVNDTKIIYLWNPNGQQWEVAIDLNNLGTGDAHDTAPQTESVTPYQCPSYVQVGDIVRLVGPDLLELAQADDLAHMPGFGMVSAKPTATTAQIILDGDAPYFNGLTTGQLYYVSDTQPGKLTSQSPSNPGTVSQRVGIARNSTTLVLLMDIGDIIAH